MNEIKKHKISKINGNYLKMLLKLLEFTLMIKFIEVLWFHQIVSNKGKNKENKQYA